MVFSCYPCSVCAEYIQWYHYLYTKTLCKTYLSKSKYPAVTEQPELFGQFSKNSTQFYDRRRGVSKYPDLGFCSTITFFTQQADLGVNYSIIYLLILVPLRRYIQLTIMDLLKEKNVNLKNPLIWKTTVQSLSCQVELRLRNISLMIRADSLKRIKNKIQFPFSQCTTSNIEKNKLQQLLCIINNNGPWFLVKFHICITAQVQNTDY